MTAPPFTPKHATDTAAGDAVRYTDGWHELLGVYHTERELFCGVIPDDAAHGRDIAAIGWCAFTGAGPEPNVVLRVQMGDSDHFEILPRLRVVLVQLPPAREG